jgi:hypothetical protein
MDQEVGRVEQRKVTHPEIAPLLQPGELVQHRAEALDALMAVTDRRILVKSGRRVALDLPFEALRRIQFDVERRVPASLVIVPEETRYEAQVLSVPAERLHEAAAAIAAIGQRLSGDSPPEG